VNLTVPYNFFVGFAATCLSERGGIRLDYSCFQAGSHAAKFERAVFAACLSAASLRPLRCASPRSPSRSLYMSEQAKKRKLEGSALGAFSSNTKMDVSESVSGKVSSALVIAGPCVMPP
jgi:hypothetical protein